MRKEPKALEIARSFFARSKPVAAICHGPQILISAGLLQGRRATCYKSVADELKEAGALYEDREVVVDANLVTSRQPADLPAFMQETMKQLRLACGTTWGKRSAAGLDVAQTLSEGQHSKKLYGIFSLTSCA